MRNKIGSDDAWGPGADVSLVSVATLVNRFALIVFLQVVLIGRWRPDGTYWATRSVN